MFQGLIDATDKAVSDYVFGLWIQFNTVANTWITSLMIIFVAIVGYMILIGKLEISLRSLFPEFLKLFAVYVVVTNAGLLTTLAYETFTSIPESIGNFLVANANEASHSKIHESVDLIWKNGMSTGTRIFDEHGWRGWLVGVSIWIVTVAFVAFTAFILMLSKLATAVLLSVAPFFIALYLFSALKPFFEGWLRQTATFALVPVLLYALLGLILAILDDTAVEMAAAASANELTLTIIAPFIVILLVATLLNTQILSWAAGICGGFALATQSAFGRSTKTAASASAIGGRLSYNRGRMLYHHLRNRRRTP